MGFFKTGELAPIRAEKTSWFTVRGLTVRSCLKSVELEVRWGHNEQYRLATAARALIAKEDQERVACEDVAKHIIIGWRNVPKEDGSGDEPYGFEGGAEIVAHMEAEKRVDLVNGFWLYVSNAANFGAPRLVDPVNLGNG